MDPQYSVKDLFYSMERVIVLDAAYMYSVKWKLLTGNTSISLKFLHHSYQQPKPLRYKETVMFALDLKTVAGICSAKDRSWLSCTSSINLA